ncbi:MAG: hypothetical protein NZ989_07580 [Bacteroidia bacterium]|nr:hypothetical protein [Bacteroidia bacterium]MDW8057837.1 hypothetical protein [Bacteroidia bacterium]
MAKLNPLGSELVYSTFIGGSDLNEGSDIAVDGSGHVYVRGYTRSTDYDVTAGAFQTTFDGGNANCTPFACIDVFVTS